GEFEPGRELGLVHWRVTASSIHAVELSFSELSVSPRLVEFDPHQFHGGNRHVLSYIRLPRLAAVNSSCLSGEGLACPPTPATGAGGVGRASDHYGPGGRFRRQPQVRLPASPHRRRSPERGLRPASGRRPGAVSPPR